MNQPIYLNPKTDVAYIKSILLEEVLKKVIVYNIYFSGQDTVRIVFQKNDVDFTISKH